MKIFCVGRNYVAHAIELNNEVPDEPVIFMKPKSALLQAHTSFYYPEFTNELDYECELVLRISKNGKYIQDRFASKYYDALSVGIDFTARDIQNDLKAKGLPWEKAKAWDNSAAVGKWIPFQNVKNKKEINFGLYKNTGVGSVWEIEPDASQLRPDRGLYFHLLFHKYRRSHFYRNTCGCRRMRPWRSTRSIH